MTKYIYVNGRFLCHKMDGIGRFSLEICKQLKKTDLKFKIIIPNWLDYENKEGFEIVKFGSLKSHFWEQINLLKFLNSEKNPLLVNLSGLGPLFYKNQIITIHDLSFYENKKWFSKSYTTFYSFTTPIVAKNARKILSVSYFSKSEIIKHLQIKQEKIEVIYNAVSNDIKNEYASGLVNSTDSFHINKNYILAVCSIDPRKNLQRLIDAFSQLDLSDYVLVLVGKTSKHFNVDLKTNLENIIFTGFISDQELSDLYKKCDFFIYPSLYEGFGIPPLEAMKNNCAVIVSDIPSLKEVCSDAALYVNPYEVESIKNGMLKIINDSALKKELKEKGNIRAEFFKWEYSGQKIYNLIKNITL